VTVTDVGSSRKVVGSNVAAVERSGLTERGAGAATERQ